jgi:hypothetical protein
MTKNIIEVEDIPSRSIFKYRNYSISQYLGRTSPTSRGIDQDQLFAGQGSFFEKIHVSVIAMFQELSSLSSSPGSSSPSSLLSS